MPRFDLIHPATTVNNDDSFGNKFVKKPLKARVHPNSNFFGRAARIIAADIMKKAKLGFLENYRIVKQNLKKCIESRIDVIMQDKVANTIEEIIQFYRIQFAYADDPQFLMSVVENAERGVAELEIPNPGDTFTSDDDFQDMSFVTANENPGVSANQQTQIFKTDNVAGERSNKFKSNTMSNQKEQRKMEYMIDDMDPTLLNAFNEELRNLCEAYLMGCSQPEVDEDEENFRLMLRNRTPYTFKKVMRVHMSKRVLNITDNLLIRIFATPKSINREELHQFLKEKGITYVKKSGSKKLYVAMAPSYEVYDHLIAMQRFVIGGSNLEFKPLYLIGKPVRKHFKKKKRPVKVEDSDESVVDEEIERLIEETENKVIKKTEITNVALTGNAEVDVENLFAVDVDDDDLEDF